MSGPSQVPAAVADYCRRWCPQAGHPIVHEVFYPGRGWKRPALRRKRVCVSWARKAKAAGVAHVALDLLGDGSRIADFTITELTRTRRGTR